MKLNSASKKLAWCSCRIII